MASNIVFIIFLFAIGACIGSFINVIVWRWPRGESIIAPPSHCPKCDHRLEWRDNLPVIGWIKLRGKCRYCGQKISPRYPIVEFCMGAIFALFYATFFLANKGPFVAEYKDDVLVSVTHLRDLAQDWPIFTLYLCTAAVLMVVSLWDADHYVIPIGVVWVLAGVGILAHALVDQRSMPGNVMIAPSGMALAAGGAIGLLISIGLLQFGLLPLSFAEGEPPLETKKDSPGPEEFPTRDYTPWQLRLEMHKEILFLLPPVLLAALSAYLEMDVPAVRHFWQWAANVDWIAGLAGSVFGALIGGMIIWVTRIAGTYGFGKEAMGLGDIHLMFGIGAVVGAGAATVIFFLAPFFGILIALYLLLTRGTRQVPYGPYLSMSAIFVMVFYFPIYTMLRPGVIGLNFMLHQLLGRG